jgi:hypothetical protein
MRFLISPGAEAKLSMNTKELQDEIQRRRVLAIISHPDIQH